jgi:kynurenine formamidase
MDGKDPHGAGYPSCSIEPINLISKGDPFNVYNMSIMNHFSTHFDAPKHYSDKLPKITELPLEVFFSDRPLLLDIPKSYNEFIQPEDLRPHADLLKGADMLMIRTGFSRLRDTEPGRYATDNPTLASASCKYLMDNFKLKIVAMDWISLTNSHHSDDGNLSHKYMLGQFHDHFTCVIEDAYFEGILGKKILRVYSLPLLVGMGVDSGPVTMIAEVE